MTFTTWPSSTASTSCRSMSISSTLPDDVCALGTTPSSAASCVASPTTPSRYRPPAFCRANTACCVSPPYALVDRGHEVPEVLQPLLQLAHAVAVLAVLDVVGLLGLSSFSSLPSSLPSGLPSPCDGPLPVSDCSSSPARRRPRRRRTRPCCRHRCRRCRRRRCRRPSSVAVAAAARTTARSTRSSAGLPPAQRSAASGRRASWTSCPRPPEAPARRRRKPTAGPPSAQPRPACQGASADDPAHTMGRSTMHYPHRDSSSAAPSGVAGNRPRETTSSPRECPVSLTDARGSRRVGSVDRHPIVTVTQW